MSQIQIVKTAAPKQKPDQAKLGFGKFFTDHMFLLDYDAGQGWHDARIVPYAPLALDPSAMVFHYAQEIFEGLKAYRRQDGGIQLFRPWENIKRMENSCERLCIPTLDPDLYLEAMTELVKLDEDWIPTAPDTSLYLRPFIIATEPHVGVHASSSYIFCIIASPVGAYYAEGLAPVKIYVESRDVRAVKGGMGYAKTGGNYAASLRAGEVAMKKGYSQVLWLDGASRRYIEEVGSMNVFFKIDGVVVTPALVGSILPGVTRKSCVDILKSWDIPVEERLLSAQELFDAADAGMLEEAWGSGTAAVISPIGKITWDQRDAQLCGGETGPLTQRLYDYLTGIQWGRIEDPFGWIYRVK